MYKTKTKNFERWKQGMYDGRLKPSDIHFCLEYDLCFTKKIKHVYSQLYTALHYNMQ